MNVRELTIKIEELRWKRNFYGEVLEFITDETYHVEYKRQFIGEKCEELQHRINELDLQIDALLSLEIVNEGILK